MKQYKGYGRSSRFEQILAEADQAISRKPLPKPEELFEIIIDVEITRDT
jgi:hypothetical protein